MSGQSLQDAAKALAAAIAGRLDLRDTDPKGAGLDQAMRRRMLSTYAQELSDLAPDASGRWLLDRMAAIESRLLAVQAAQVQAQMQTQVTPRSLPVRGAPASGGVAPEIAEEVLLPRRVALVCDENLTREGFYGIERGGNGKPFYWLGPDPTAMVFLPKLAAPVEVRLHIQSAFVPDVLPDIRVALDGGAWTQVRVEGTEGRIVLVAAPPVGSERRAASMRLDIDAVRTESPADKGGSDPRRLGIAIEEIVLTSLGDRPAG